MTLSTADLGCPEKRLLVSCARTRTGPQTTEEIRKLASDSVDWDFLLTSAAENSILPLLARQLSQAAPDIVPSSELERLKNGSRANAVRCLVLTAELIKIIDLLRSKGIQAIPYKGPVLAVQAYGELALREFDDLDIILRQSDMAMANAMMQEIGYSPRFGWYFAPSTSVVPGEYNYRDQKRRLIVEFHTEQTLRHFPVPPDLDDITRRLAPVILSGHEVPTFGAEDMLPLLCIHGSKDFWERISWIADISEFVQSRPELDWDQVFQRADALRAGRMVHIGLALAANLLSAPLPQEISMRVQNDSVACQVASEVARRHFRRESPERDAAARFNFRRKMVAGMLPGWRYSMRLATDPADEDGQMMHLPRPLVPLYAVLRPFRLLRKYATSGGRPAGHA
ncbi:MAG TPA: nucleotidyltransferase family protein [Candidatus Cybelea sp.]|nr:nucleotidyltransferase family protein [Candidatus Cybelea sp.]